MTGKNETCEWQFTHIVDPKKKEEASDDKKKFWFLFVWWCDFTEACHDRKERNPQTREDDGIRAAV